ncbi:hypothetical protein DH2020_014210 [Rehmannia glutinosa]|uniref:Retrotransposon gag domain-containing protein n=1 Tax=Rehmannia glutinosa TaxID=99300 RepID=A0ABR0WZR8_REHGL
MAEGTRMRDLQEAQKRLDQILQTEALKREAAELKMQEQIAGINSEVQDQLTGINNKYEHLTHTLATIQLQLLNISKGKGSMEEESILGEPGHGTNSEGNFTRFEELKETRIIAEFNKLKHTGSYSDYVERFEELKACMIMLNSEYSEEYFVASFVSGLSEELQAFINMFEPKTLQQTIELGKKQLHTLEAITKKVRQPTRSYQNTFPNPRRYETTPTVPPKNPSPMPKPPLKLLTASEMAARREKGVCYNCDEQFTYGHSLNSPVHQMEEIQMSLNSLAGEDGLTTMRLFGESGTHRLHILIDSGSTLSFIQESTAKRLGCHLENAKPILVKVANGQRMVSSVKATGFKWTMQGHEFTYSLRVLQNEGCDLILGGDWLKSGTPIELDYEKMTFTVTLKGKRVKIQALTSAADCKFISGPTLYKMMHMEAETEIEEIYMLKTPLIPMHTLNLWLREELSGTREGYVWVQTLNSGN